MIRPGPPWIEAGTAPGGIVLHVYQIDDARQPWVARLLLVRALSDVAEAERTAEADGDFVAALIAADTPVVIVAYDGDTGERMRPPGLAQ